MRRRGASDDAVEVEMVEVDDLTGVDGAGPPLVPDADAQDSDRHARRARVLRWVGLGVIAALATGVVVVNVQVAREAAARQAALADLPWVLPHMDGPLEEVWRAPGGWVVAETSEVLVTSPNTGEGGLYGVDVRTGEVVWERPGSELDASCYGVVDYSGRQDDPVGFVPPEPDLLMCVPGDAYGQDARPTPDVVVEIAVEIVFLDVATGVQVSSVTLDGAVLLFESVDGDMVLSFVRSDAGMTVLRLDPHTGDVLWTYRSDPGVLPQGISGLRSYGTVDGVLRMDGEFDLSIALDDGTVVASSPSDTADPTVPVARLADGGTVEWAHEPTGSDWTVRVLEPDGTVRFEVRGTPWWFGRADGSAADLVLVQQQGSVGADAQGSQVVALDAATGETLWSLPDLGDMPIALIDGVALTSGATAGAIDIRSGRRLWELPVDQSVYVGALTDGELVLVTVREAGTLQLVALSVRTGSEAWRMRLPVGTSEVSSKLGGLVLAMAGNEIIAFG